MMTKVTSHRSNAPRLLLALLLISPSLVSSVVSAQYDSGANAERVIDTDAGVDADPLPMPTVSVRVPDPRPTVTPTTTSLTDPDAASAPDTVIKTIIGLLVLMTLAYLGAHPTVRALEERLGLSQVIAAGFPFVLLGLVARHPAIGVLNDRVLSELGPLLRLGLGWIGFVVGFRFDARLFRNLAPGTGSLVLLSTLLPFSFVVASCAIVLSLVSQGSESLAQQWPQFVRDAIILGAAAAMTAKTATRLVKSTESSGIIGRVIRLEELVGVAGLALADSYFRPESESTTWHLPGTAWFLLAVGLGVTLGVLIYAMLYRAAREQMASAEFLVLSLGSISFAAGIAGYLHLSSVVVAFVAGALLVNLPGDYHARLRDTLLRLEHPILLLSLVIIGALWRIDDWRGWLLMPVFVLARMSGKWFATSPVLLGREGLHLRLGDRYALGLAPLGTLAIAIVINAQLLHPGNSISPMVSAVLGGGVLTEIFVQWFSRRQGVSSEAHVVPSPPTGAS
ncbi:MAG: hypothetical protein SGI86_01320 [Deltaproteobacteria bacterium]|nr:hypothetical protein [Deltaproteobacteria bacterium]